MGVGMRVGVGARVEAGRYLLVREAVAEGVWAGGGEGGGVRAAAARAAMRAAVGCGQHTPRVARVVIANPLVLSRHDLCLDHLQAGGR